MAVTIPENKKLITADDKCFQYMGRIDFDNPARPVLVWPATTVDTIFTGTSAAVLLKTDNLQDHCYFCAIVDGIQQTIELRDYGEDVMYVLAEGLEDKPHTLRLVKKMAAAYYAEFVGIVVDKDAQLSNPQKKYDYKIEVYGDSVSAGEVTEAIFYEGQSDPPHHSQYDNATFSYPYKLAQRLNAQLHDCAQGGIAILDGTGYFCSDQLTGMLSCYDKIQYSPYRPTKPWDFSRYTPDCVIIALGQNDHNPEPERIKTPEYRRFWKDSYKSMLCDLMGKYPEAKFVLILTILGHDPTWDDALDEITQEVGSDRVTHFRFRRTGCGTCGHPRATEQEEMAEELYRYLIGGIL